MTASLDRITARCGERIPAEHQRRWGTAGLVQIQKHLTAAAIRREQFRKPTAGGHLDVDVEVADLSAYDAVGGTRKSDPGAATEF